MSARRALESATQRLVGHEGDEADEADGGQDYAADLDPRVHLRQQHIVQPTVTVSTTTIVTVLDGTKPSRP